MDISRVKYKLNHEVMVVDRQHDLNAEYTLTGCILRKRKNKFYYQAELRDANQNSLVIADLENVHEI